MEKWVLSIIGIVALSVLIDIILPDGDMAKYIKGVFSIVTICVIVAPLPGLISTIKNSDNKAPTYDDIAVDDAFLSDFDGKKEDILSQNISRLLLSHGVSTEEVGVKMQGNEIVSINIVVRNSGDTERALKLVKEVVNAREVRVVARGST